jgi:hypothetical protein
MMIVGFVCLIDFIVKWRLATKKSCTHPKTQLVASMNSLPMVDISLVVLPKVALHSSLEVVKRITDNISSIFLKILTLSLIDASEARRILLFSPPGILNKNFTKDSRKTTSCLKALLLLGLSFYLLQE